MREHVKATKQIPHVERARSYGKWSTSEGPNIIIPTNMSTKEI